MSVSFVIESWAACAPGLDTPPRWRHWAGAPWLPEGEPAAALAAVPPLLRRRFAPLGRLAAEVALDLARPSGTGAQAGATTRTGTGTGTGTQATADTDTDTDGPTIFASRYGETARCLELLALQARGEALSPTAFGLSVHNAIGAMVAIVRGDRRNSTALAAGRLTAAAGVAEALALLADGAPNVSLIVYDAPLPTDYAGFQDEPAAHFAWAWRLRRPQAGEAALRLAWGAASARDAAAPAAQPLAHLPASLQALWFGLGNAAELVQVDHGRCCRWSRDV